MNVKIYNLKSAVEQITSCLYTLPGDEINAAVVCPKGVILTDADGIHTTHEMSEGHNAFIDLACCPMNSIRGVPTFGNSQVFSSESIRLSIKQLLECTPVKECELTDFIRHFGRRIESNYDTLLKTIKELGGDPKDYPRRK
jgi:hypothetical protein